MRKTPTVSEGRSRRADRGKLRLWREPTPFLLSLSVGGTDPSVHPSVEGPAHRRMPCRARLKILPTFWTRDPHFQLAWSPVVTQLVLHLRTGDEDTDNQMTADGGSPVLTVSLVTSSPLPHCHLVSATRGAACRAAFTSDSGFTLGSESSFRFRNRRANIFRRAGQQRQCDPDMTSTLVVFVLR